MADSLANMEFMDKNTNTVMKLPIRLQKKQALNIMVKTKFIVKGTADQIVLSEREEVPSLRGIYLPKYKYELCFEDIQGNFFDQFGNRINFREADLWWLLVNTFEPLKNWNIWPYIRHSILILRTKIGFRIKLFLWNIGL